VLSIWRVYLVLALLVALAVVTPHAQERAVHALRLDAASSNIDALRQAATVIASMRHDGRLAPLAAAGDALVPGATHERLQQMQAGVPVWGSTITRQQRNGVTVSTYGSVFDGLDAVDTTPSLSADDARRIAATASGVTLGPYTQVQLYVLARDGETPRLVYSVRAAKPTLMVYRYFIDAHTGAVVESRLDTRTEAAVGVGTSVLGVKKKVSASTLGSLFVLLDALRPEPIQTYDLRGEPDIVQQILNGQRPLLASDLGADSDNTWTDPALVDAHTNTGYTYDYYFKRFGRLGIDNRGGPVLSIVHPVLRNDIQQFLSGSSTGDVGLENGDFFVNAGYMGNSIVVYGDGLPPGFALEGPGGLQSVDYLSGALDIVAHEISHGVIEATSNLAFEGEPGALNEAFCDIMGTSVEFFFQQAGSGRGKADYLIAEDVLSPGAARSMSNPAAFQQPAHYSQRFTGTGDNGGVHVNSGIVNNAFYLAIEGGRNPVSGLAVTGVGSAHRDEIEKIFYRAFTLMLPSDATFSTARAATIQSARDLYGAGSAPEIAMTQAWNAVGVN
jgi:Zn-dependent metalloprotease